jgi:acetamidase/formamidase
MAHRHAIYRHHFGWDNSLPAAVRITPGESLEFEVVDSSAGQLSPPSTSRVFLRRVTTRISPTISHVTPRMSASRLMPDITTNTTAIPHTGS